MKLAPSESSIQPELTPPSGLNATQRMLWWHRQIRETAEQEAARKAFVADCAARGIVAKLDDTEGR